MVSFARFEVIRLQKTQAEREAVADRVKITDPEGIGNHPEGRLANLSGTL